MLGLKKKTEKVENHPSVTPIEVFTLPEVIQQYVTRNDDVLDNDFTNIDTQIKKNAKIITFLKSEKRSGYGNEETIYQNKIEKVEEQNKKLELQKSIITKQIEVCKIGYQKIDLSFLSMRKRGKGKLSYYPAFSTHKYVSDEKKYRFLDCQLDITTYNVEIPNGNYISSYIVLKNLLESIIGDIDIEKFGTSWNAGLRYSLNGNSICNSDTRVFSAFKGIIPETTKEKIKEATKIFTGCESRGIFLIKECPSWLEHPITKDPLIVGVIGDHAYLIDHFDCTDLEHWIKQEFTE